MYKFINGWNKEKTIQAIYEGNNGLKSQKKKSVCMYRGPNNNKCAIGCFIPDDKYTDAMEELPATHVIRIWHLVNYMPLVAEAMEELQTIHDTAHEDQDPRPLLKKWLDANTAE